MPVRPLILSPPIVVRALRDDPADLPVRAGGGQRWRALRALPALRALFSMTLYLCNITSMSTPGKLCFIVKKTGATIIKIIYPFSCIVVINTNTKFTVYNNNNNLQNKQMSLRSVIGRPLFIHPCCPPCDL